MKKTISVAIVSAMLSLQLFPLITHAEEIVKHEPVAELTAVSSSDSPEAELNSAATVSTETTTETESTTEVQTGTPVEASLQNSEVPAAVTNNEEISVQPRAELVPIPDETLRKLINTKLGHSTDWETYTPTKQELASIRGTFRLDFNTANRTQFTSLEGLQYLTGISELYAYYVDFLNLDDLNLISQLTQLTYISMGSTNITSMDFASTLPNLTGMVFGGNHISDVSASLNYYNSSKRKQYNFIGQTLSKEVTLAPGETTVEPIRIIGVDGNQVAIANITVNDHFTLENGQFVGHDLQPGNTYLIKYSFVDRSINHAGRLTGDATIKVAVPLIAGADVTVKYVDESGTELVSPKTLSGNIGDSYTSEEETIPGYTLKEIQGVATGKFTDQAQTVVYVYSKDPVPGADVTVKYVDEVGTELVSPKTLKGNIGAPYTSEEETIPGYTLKEIQGEVAGKFTDQAQTVIYVYSKDPVAGADVTVKYVDEAGIELASPKTLKGNIGASYTSVEEAISGYTLKEIQGAAAGKFTDQAQTVVYVYKKSVKPHIVPPTNEIPGAPTQSTTEKETVQKEEANSTSLQPQITSESQDKSLPQKSSATKLSFPKTGEKQQSSQRLSVMGIGLLGIFSCLVIWKHRRTKNI
jgi:hypothetical protein